MLPEISSYKYRVLLYFGNGFGIFVDVVEVEAFGVQAFLVVQEVAAIFRGPKRRPYKPIVVGELVDRLIWSNSENTKIAMEASRLVE